MRKISSNKYLYSQVVLKPDCLVTYPVFSQGKIYLDKEKRERSLSNLKNNGTKGVLSLTSIKKLKYAIQLLTSQAKWKKVYDRQKDRSFRFKITFITLTLSSPQGNLTDNYLKRNLLTPFIQDLKRYHKVVNYVWKAEAQENGNIHFHITTDVYIHYSELRRLWNKHQNKLDLLESFYSEYGHKNPNSTDVHSVKGVANLANYMVKYMCKKTEGRRLIVGSLWGCSDSLKMKCTFPDVKNIEVFNEVQQVLALKGTLISDYFTYTEIHYSELPVTLKKHFYKFLNEVKHGRVESSLFEEREDRSDRVKISRQQEPKPQIPLYTNTQLSLFS